MSLSQARLRRVAALIYCHSRDVCEMSNSPRPHFHESGNPVFVERRWVPACAGTTAVFVERRWVPACAGTTMNALTHLLSQRQCALGQRGQQSRADRNNVVVEVVLRVVQEAAGFDAALAKPQICPWLSLQ